MCTLSQRINSAITTKQINMAYVIKKNKQGLYNIKSSISDECYHPDKKWLTEDEAKRILIQIAFGKFLDKVIEIDFDFPTIYMVNDVVESHRGKTNTFFLETYDKPNTEANKILNDKILEIEKKFNITLLCDDPVDKKENTRRVEKHLREYKKDFETIFSHNDNHKGQSILRMISKAFRAGYRKCLNDNKN